MGTGSDASRRGPPGGSTETDLEPRPARAAQPRTRAAEALPLRSRERYERLGEHARGGLGLIVRARDRELGRSLAIKEIQSTTKGSIERFVREAQITMRLEHPSIVPVHDAGRWESGEPFFAMKLVAGRTLKEVVRENATLAQRMTLLPNVIAVVDAVAYAHDQRVIHRDLKPSNVLVGAFGETIVIDWGLAKDLSLSDDPVVSAASPPRGAGHATEVGMVVGTPTFMPPEQARGEDVDERADVYALGALLYFVLCGRAPYEGESSDEVLARVRERAPEPLSALIAGVPADLAAIVTRAMARDRAERYPRALQLAEDLKRFQAGQMVAAHRYTFAERAGRWVRRHRPIAAASLVFASLGAAGLVGFGVRESRLRRVAEVERDRADQTSLVFLEQQGRDELDSGRPMRAAVYLAEAYKRDPDHLAVRSLLTEALKSLEAHRIALVSYGRDVPSGAYSPDGALLATASDDRTVRLWDVQTGALVRAIEGFQGALEWVSFGHDGRTLVTSAAGQHPRVSTWDVPTGRPLAGFDLPVAVFRAELTPDDANVVTGDFEGHLRIIELDTGRTRLDETPCHDRISTIVFRPGTDQMAIGSHDGTVSVWDWRAGKRLSTLSGFDRGIASADYSDDGRYLLVAEMAHHIHVYDATTLARLRTIHVPDAAQDPDAFFSPDARTVVSGTKDGRISVWHTSSGALLRLIDAQTTGQLYRASLRRDGREVATMGGDGAVHLWSLDTALDYRVLTRQPIVDARVLTSAFIDGGRTIVEPGGDGEVRLIDAESGRVVRSFHVGLDADTIAIDATVTRLATAGESTTAYPPRIWDLRAGTLVATLAPQAPPVTFGLAATSDGTAFLTGDYVGELREWDATSGRLRAEHAVTSARISSIATSPDGTTIAVADEHGTVFLLDRDGAIKRSWQAHNRWIESLLFAEGGRTLVTVGRQDHGLAVWRAPFDGPPVHLMGHTGMVLRASMSDDGRRIASVSEDGTARLWDAHTGELLRVIEGPSTTALFRPGTDELLTTGPHGYAVAWSTALDTRSPAEVSAFVASRSPWELVEGRLQLRPH